MKSKRVRAVFVPIMVITLLVFALLTACSSGESENVNIYYPVVINEVMASNSAFAPTAEGKYYDWVELHNTSDDEVDLSNCYISDSADMPLQYRLDGLVIEGGGYAIVYLSDKNCVDEAGMYHANFKLSSAGEALMMFDSYGNSVAQVMIPALGENVSYGLIPGSTSEYSMFAMPSPGAENHGAYSNDASELAEISCPVIINEYLSRNSYTNYDIESDYGDWVELYNPSDSEYDLTGASLTDDESSPGKWHFPQGASIGAGEYLLVWCDGKDKLDSAGEYHTNFSLGDTDTEIMLCTNQGLIASKLDLISLPKNVSCGYPAGSNELKLFSRPTPGSENNVSGYELTAVVTADINDGLLISEVLSVSWGKGAYSRDYIELYNSTSSSVSLSGYTIAQTPGEVVFAFPSISMSSGEYLLVWCDGTLLNVNKGDLHCPIKLGQGGESIYLADSSGRICDYFETGKTSYGVSSGRVGNDCSKRYFFTEPTPKEQNSPAYADGYTPAPEISVIGGYVEAGTTVEITAPEGCTIYYTTNGSTPTRSSKQYGEPITINKTTVLKAACHISGSLMSQAVCETYFVEDMHDIAVVSMSGDKTDLLGENGFYENYKSGAEIATHIEYYTESGKKAVEFDAGASIFGQYSRTEDQKGIKLELKERYGENEVSYPFFKDSVSGVSTFGSLLLRACGQDWNRAKLRDELVPAIVRGRMDIDYQEFVPVALYIDGEYFGLYYIRERLDAAYLEHKYGFVEGSYDLIKSQMFVQAGDVDEYVALEDYAREHDLSVQKNYEYMCSQIDVDSLINFWITETYFANPDTGNIRCYKADDGKWRWMIYDFDWGMTQSTWKKNLISKFCLGKAHGANLHMSNIIIRKMLGNESFRNRFISLYCYHLNTTFDPDRTVPILESMAAVIKTEIPRQAERWGKPSAATWENQLTFLERFLNEKPEMAKEQLMEAFGLSSSQLNKYLRENKEFTPYEY